MHSFSQLKLEELPEAHWWRPGRRSFFPGGRSHAWPQPRTEPSVPRQGYSQRGSRICHQAQYTFLRIHIPYVHAWIHCQNLRKVKAMWTSKKNSTRLMSCVSLPWNSLVSILHKGAWMSLLHTWVTCWSMVADDSGEARDGLCCKIPNSMQDVSGVNSVVICN